MQGGKRRQALLFLKNGGARPAGSKKFLCRERFQHEWNDQTVLKTL